MINQLRLAGMLGFLLGMPVLAVPQVNGWLEERLLGTESVDMAAAPPSSSAAVSGGKSAVPGEKDKSRPERETSVPHVALAEPALAEELSTVPPGVERIPPANADVDGVSFDEIQRRLRNLGATYWHLEVLTEESSPYRFECRVPLPGHESYQRTFLAESDDALQSMRQVLERAEAWRTAQSAGGIDRGEPPAEAVQQ